MWVLCEVTEFPINQERGPTDGREACCFVLVGPGVSVRLKQSQSRGETGGRGRTSFIGVGASEAALPTARPPGESPRGQQ